MQSQYSHHILLLLCIFDVLSLSPQYEAYKPMAEREIHKIIQQARQRWDIRHVAIAHRIGVVPTTESSVEIAISSAHRREALEAVHFAIDALKAQVPIWKKEVYAGEATAEWKENKESAAPTLAQQQEEEQWSRRRGMSALIATAAAVTMVAVIAMRSSSRTR